MKEEQEGERRKKEEVTMFSCRLQSMVQSVASADVSYFCRLVESIHPFTCIPVVSAHTKSVIALIYLLSLKPCLSCRLCISMQSVLRDDQVLGVVTRQSTSGSLR